MIMLDNTNDDLELENVVFFELELVTFDEMMEDIMGKRVTVRTFDAMEK